MASPVSRGGFTLIELIIAMLIGGILSAVLFQLFLGQTQFARLQTAREEVQQNARATLEIITSELRGLGPDGIIAAGPNSIHFRAPRATGLVCGSDDADLAVIFPAVALTAIQANPALAGQLAVQPYGVLPSWRFLNLSDITEDRLSDATDWCRNINPSYAGAALAANSPARMYTGLPVDPPPAPALQEADWVYLYAEARYAVEAAAPGEPQWIVRGEGAGATFPFAGPVSDDTGLAFAYFDSDGQPILDLTDQADRNRVARIEVTVITQSHAKFGGVPQQDSASTIVHLRN